MACYFFGRLSVLAALKVGHGKYILPYIIETTAHKSATYTVNKQRLNENLACLACKGSTTVFEHAVLFKAAPTPRVVLDGSLAPNRLETLGSRMYICMVITYSMSMNQLGKVANPARGQMDRGN